MIDGDSGDADENGGRHDQGSETVRQRLRDVYEAHGMMHKVGSRGRVRNIERSGW